MLALQSRLQAAVVSSARPGRFAIAVTDLQTGASIGVDGDRQQLGGCLLNFFVLLEAVRGAQAGDYPLADVDALIVQTIWSSDATAAHHLYEYVGAGDVVVGVRKVDVLIHNLLRLDDVVLDHPPAFPEDSLGVSVDNLVTAAAMNRALGALYRGDVLAEPFRSYLLEAMTKVKPGLNYLTAALPAEATVSHKNGFFWDPQGWVDNDAGVVRFQGGGETRAYAVTFLSEAVPVLYDDIPLGQQLVHLTWEYFTGNYP